MHFTLVYLVPNIRFIAILEFHRTAFPSQPKLKMLRVLCQVNFLGKIWTYLNLEKCPATKQALKEERNIKLTVITVKPSNMHQLATSAQFTASWNFQEIIVNKENISFFYIFAWSRLSTLKETIDFQSHREIHKILYVLRFSKPGFLLHKCTTLKGN